MWRQMYRYPRNACPQLNTSRSTTRNAIAQAVAAGRGPRGPVRSGPALAQRCRSVGVGVGVVAAVRGSAICSALSGSIRPEPKLSSRSPAPSRLALACRMRRTSAGVSLGLRSSRSATIPLTSAAATEVPVVIW